MCSDLLNNEAFKKAILNSESPLKEEDCEQLCKNYDTSYECNYDDEECIENMRDWCYGECIYCIEEFNCFAFELQCDDEDELMDDFTRTGECDCEKRLEECETPDECYDVYLEMCANYGEC